MKVPALLKNKYVCYALMALAALNVIGYVTVKAWECLALFALAGYSAHCYCNNVSVAIIAALFECLALSSAGGNSLDDRTTSP